MLQEYKTKTMKAKVTAGSSKKRPRSRQSVLLGYSGASASCPLPLSSSLAAFSTIREGDEDDRHLLAGPSAAGTKRSRSASSDVVSSGLRSLLGHKQSLLVQREEELRKSNVQIARLTAERDSYRVALVQAEDSLSSAMKALGGDPFSRSMGPCPSLLPSLAPCCTWALDPHQTLNPHHSCFTLQSSRLPVPPSQG
jgi:hypothetical protein